ncbi:hypothetical protein NA57DRAFT_74459 [Rhizodiscina lignyota]|uniref:LisH domain-containing protein n=1 Tax=Rhizodiscina lignyota TaxID=1504668 RepID=A0A9P4IKE4_9PEZI|nr:hypothetical protein NA57DRAFT_74459 [Rhizodiscina lignyota]
MNQQMNMAGMAGAGGPVGGGAQAANAMARGAINQNRVRLDMLNTYIYDYFIRQEQWDVARAMHKAAKTSDNMPLSFADGKPSPSGRDVNGVGDAMDTDSKDFKKPADLPDSKFGPNDGCFLMDWWSQFWDLYDGQRQKGGQVMNQYIQTNQNQQRMRQDQQNRMLQAGTDPRVQQMMFNRAQQTQNGMPTEMAKVMMGRGQMNPQQQMIQNRMMQQAKMNNMQRDGSMNMGEQRSQSPGSGDNNAPSPKRQRMEGNFNGQMGPAGRGQGMPGQPGSMQGPNGPPLMLQNGLPPQLLDQKQQFEAIQQGGQASPMATQGNPDGGNHALQDYQMQLMLLEQQNKKRLLMARQEQDSMSHPAGSGPGIPPQQFAPTMSPSGSRAGGPSPNPAEMAKRGTPKMGPGNLPNPNSPADPNLQGNRGSPTPNFDPNMNPQGINQFYPMGVPGMQPPAPSSHPRAPGMPINAQQMNEFQRRAMQNGQMFPQGGVMQNAQQPGQQGQQPGQQPPIGTPRQPTNMGPPPAPPTGGEQGRTNPSSPSQQNAAPPTPNQGNKNIPNKGAKKDKQPPKKAANKAKNQGNTGATPASEAEPPTPTPSTPITPMHPSSFGPQKNGAPGIPGAAVPGVQQPAAAPAQPAPPAGGLDPNSTAPFGDIGGDTFGNLDLANFDSGDVLENFDFDSFLHTDDTSGAFTFDNMNFGAPDGVEAGGDV